MFVYAKNNNNKKTGNDLSLLRFTFIIFNLTHLQVKTGSTGFIHDIVSMFERGKLQNKTGYY